MDNPIRILHLEDNSYDATLVAIELKKEYFSVDIKVAANHKDFEELLNTYSFDVVLADNNIPNYNGIDALQYSKANFPEMPFIFVSGTLGEDKAILAMRYGAADFVDKNHIEKLGYALRRVLNEANAKKQLVSLNDAIVESEERLRYVVKASREMVWDMDVTTGTVNWNTGGENLFGYFPNQVENTLDWWSQKLHPEEKEKVLEGFNDFLASKEESWHSEYRFANGDGGYTWVADNGCALRDADGKAYRVIGSIMDISQLHKVQDDLLLSKKLIEESEKLKSSLLDNINHELRTPMNGILGFADLLVNQVEKPEAKIMVDNILYSGRRLLNTLKSIMDVAQLASGKYPVHLSLNDLSVIIQDRLHHYTKMAEEKGLSIITNIDNSVIANVDAPGLVNVLDHLVNNAVKFTLKGWVEISTNYVKSDNKSLPSISVKDTGIGITPDKQKIIFQDFRQASEGKDRSYQGTGLGLTIVQRIMELLNGEITLNSEPGIGSTFTLIFPSVPSSQKIAGPLGPPEVSVPQPKLEEILSEEYKVLIVEDDKVNAELTSFYLEGVATVDIAYDGESAVRMAEHNKYSAILMDINLGVGMDGFEATKRIRQLQGYKHIPIIATTGYTLYNEIELIKNSGFTEYLPKPFSKKELMTSIKRNSLINQY